MKKKISFLSLDFGSDSERPDGLESRGLLFFFPHSFAISPSHVCDSGPFLSPIYTASDRRLVLLDPLPSIFRGDVN